MHVTFRGVNDAFRGLVQRVDEGERGENDCEVIRVGSRNGPVFKIIGPVTVAFTRPMERVLMNSARDQNPFFVLYEGLHMLAGRNDVAPLAYYASRMSDYSDDDVTLNGAYGYRWRNGSRFWANAGPLDQLKIVVEHLRQSPDSRRAVIQMWNVEDDLLKVDDQHGQFSRDVCCNLCVCFSVRRQQVPYMREDEEVVPFESRLDVTVFNRSNDLVWGLLGGDMVHFSMLQEYVAAHLGVEVGVYHQVTNDLHVYVESNSGFRPREWLAEYESPETSTERWYTDDATKTVPLVRDPATFDRELPDFVGVFNGEKEPWDCVEKYEEPFFQTVAGPMLTAFHCHKQRNYGDALNHVDRVEADDWRTAGREWIERRKRNWELRQLKEESL